ncbi:MAG: hypothetical protein PHS95_00700 [Candidatus Pacebacteria bacterium]|nr:hypothetical protein [Candidatus Paceibacterota bacterium]
MAKCHQDACTSYYNGCKKKVRKNLMDYLLKLEESYKAGKIELKKFKVCVQINLDTLDVACGVWIKSPEESMLRNLSFARMTELDCERIDDELFLDEFPKVNLTSTNR